MLNVNLIDSKKDIKNIKWDEIFTLYEFKSYLVRSQFIELSLLNKLLREKLKQKIFYKVIFNHDFLLQFPDYFYPQEFDIVSGFGDESETILNFQINRIDPFIAGLIRGLNNFSSHLKRIEFDRLLRSGYFIVPLASNFTYLSNLSICDCELDLKFFNKLVLKLDKLEFLSMKNLQFLVLDEEWPLDSETLLPQSLKELELGNMRLRKTDLHKNPYKFLFIDKNGFMNGYYYAPPQCLPNLKHLIISKDTDFYSDYVPNLLNLNPHLTRITFPCYYLSSNTVKSLSAISSINEMQIEFKYDNYEFRNFDIIPLASVDILSIKSIPASHHRKVYTLISLCPNLTKLYAYFEYYSDGFIEGMLSILGQLKAIELEIFYFSNAEFDLSIFSNIETLKLDIDSDQIIHYKLPVQLSKLKLIKLASNNYSGCFDLMLKNYKNSSIWSVKLIGQDIICRAITS
ncbi:hypothetical protein CONCODRAFT_10159 [Conidiobolus coronatus NRRL 28638]|uniref:RNI-like protein n=1 Tax=Conidiobolus coronatus (strain ATCC 28846 / CBS 209.66 / NRRL 28638) TaxID=796925 RepID=A0A137NYF4_CONC2|nr:hypothetical protein CONCODRAFT_10159 [Conidiobolus coronatus NRRL 28638]|eukprot:KXN67708.1 hypothetical protein CONCODRAFT_10159 [Conidiobolus coronatus NRRL 28638]